ncbi:hypothetical protein UlMin_041660 [Ulmus minor]
MLYKKKFNQIKQINQNCAKKKIHFLTLSRWHPSPSNLQLKNLFVPFFELRKHISYSLQLSNKTDSYVAFKVKTTNPKKYCVHPNTRVVLPRSTCDVIVTMQAQKEAPSDMQCKDKFLLQSFKVNDGTNAKDINVEMFNKEAGHMVEE